jgi:YidC/Oxa1 family membrane protein insertase
MFSILPWVMTIILSGFAAGLVIYWTFNNLFSTIQQYIIMRRMGVDVDIIGNIMGRITPAKEAVAEATEEITDTAKEKVEEVIEETPKEVSPPKPKKSKKKK